MRCNCNSQATMVETSVSAAATASPPYSRIRRGKQALMRLMNLEHKKPTGLARLLALIGRLPSLHTHGYACWAPILRKIIGLLGKVGP